MVAGRVVPRALVFSRCFHNRTLFFFFNLGEMFIQGDEWEGGVCMWGGSVGG